MSESSPPLETSDSAAPVTEKTDSADSGRYGRDFVVPPAPPRSNRRRLLGTMAFFIALFVLTQSLCDRDAKSKIDVHLVFGPRAVNWQQVSLEVNSKPEAGKSPEKLWWLNRAHQGEQELTVRITLPTGDYQMQLTATASKGAPVLEERSFIVDGGDITTIRFD